MKVPPFGFKVLRGPIRVEDIVRWGVWLGQHICGCGGGEGRVGLLPLGGWVRANLWGLMVFG